MAPVFFGASATDAIRISFASGRTRSRPAFDFVLSTCAALRINLATISLFPPSLHPGTDSGQEHHVAVIQPRLNHGLLGHELVPKVPIIVGCVDPYQNLRVFLLSQFELPSSLRPGIRLLP